VAISNVSPGVYTEELDFSLYAARLATAIYGVVGVATKGQTNRLTLTANEGTLETNFGPAAPSIARDEDGVRIGGTQGLYHMKHFLKQGSIGYFIRVAGSNLAYASVDLNNVGTYYGGYVGAVSVLRVVAITEGTYFNGNVSVQVTHVDTNTYNLDIFEQGVRVETYFSVTQATVAGQVNGVSRLVTVEVLDATQIPGETLDPITARPIQVALDGGNDGLYASTQGSVEYPNIKDGGGNDTLKIVSIREGVLGNVNDVPLQGFYVKLDETVIGLDTYLRIGAYFNGSLIPGEEFTALTKAELISRVEDGSNFFSLVDITAGLEPNAATPTNYFLTGGLTNSDVIGAQVGTVKTGLQIMRNAELVDTNIISAPGMYHRPVVDELISIAETRQDAIALVASPFDLSVTEMVDWHNGDLTPEAEIPQPPIAALNSSYATLVYQWVRTYDSFNDLSVWTSSEGTHASIMAFTDTTSDPWFAPAGLNRGAPTFIEDITYSPDLDEREQLYGNVGAGQNAINPFVNFAGIGIALWGQRTLQRAPTALDRVNVRRLLNVLKKTIATSSQYLVFDPNDPTLWSQWEMLVRPFLKSVQARRGLVDWEARMDATTTTELLRQQNTALGRIFIQPTPTAEKIFLQFILTPTGASFEEILGGRGL
jgi:phage tail sheath protein FI